MALIDERAGQPGLARGHVGQFDGDLRRWAGKVVVMVMPRQDRDALALPSGESLDVRLAADACFQKLSERDGGVAFDE